MTTIIMSSIIIVLLIINIILSIKHSPFYDEDIPQHNAMDKYNVVESDKAWIYKDIDIRLSELEDKFKYHIQSTDELKPKQADEDELKW